MALRFSSGQKKKASARTEDDYSCYDDIYSLELPPEQLRRLKQTWLVLSSLATVLFVVINVVPNDMSLNGLIGLLCILTLIPWVEYWHGLVRILLNQKEELRFTLYRATYRRFCWAARGVLTMLCITLLLEIILMRKGGIPVGSSVLYWSGTVICILLLWTVVWLTKRHPANVIRQEKPKRNN